jgi:uncharacterized protein involved in exopolysaccharide biosynthesis
MLQSLPPERVQDGPTPVSMDGTQGLLETLRSQRASASAQLEHDQSYYGPNYPEIRKLNAQIKALDREIAQEEAAVVNKAKDAFGIAHAAEDQARGVLQTRVHELYGQRDDIVRYELLTEEYESNRLACEKPRWMRDWTPRTSAWLILHRFRSSHRACPR